MSIHACALLLSSHAAACLYCAGFGFPCVVATIFWPFHVGAALANLLFPLFIMVACGAKPEEATSECCWYSSSRTVSCTYIGVVFWQFACLHVARLPGVLLLHSFEWCRCNNLVTIWAVPMGLYNVCLDCWCCCCCRSCVGPSRQCGRGGSCRQPACVQARTAADILAGAQGVCTAHAHTPRTVASGLAPRGFVERCTTAKGRVCYMTVGMEARRGCRGVCATHTIPPRR